MRARVTSSRFVGRTGELAALERASREAAEQRPVVVLLGGESGVGKTRLVREFERRMGEAAEEDVLVLRGEAVEEAEGELPYAPLIGALRPLVRERNPALDELSRGTRTQLAALLPGLDEEPAPTTRSDASAQLRLFEGLLELIDVLSRDRVLVLTLEDLHWADRSTRTFVDFLARSLRRERVMLLLSYRTDELHRRHPLRSLLAELERLDRVRRIELEPFDRVELAEALTDIICEAPTEQLVVGGLYRYVRNPMYLAVGAVILGQAAVLGWWVLVAYALVFGATVWSFVHWYEEPTLSRRFGPAYDEYRRSVPGWWPRLRSSRNRDG